MWTISLQFAFPRYGSQVPEKTVENLSQRHRERMSFPPRRSFGVLEPSIWGLGNYYVNFPSFSWVLVSSVSSALFLYNVCSLNNIKGLTHPLNYIFFNSLFFLTEDFQLRWKSKHSSVLDSESCIILKYFNKSFHKNFRLFSFLLGM